MRWLLGFLCAALVLSGCGPECMAAPGLDAQSCAALDAMQLPATLPQAIGNAKADDEAAALLGFSLFFDSRLSAGQDTRCATCHLPERVFSDGLQTSKGVQTVDRNSPSIFTAAWHRWQMWDGKADSLWSQPLLALENPKEMAYSRLELAHRVATSYAEPYQAVFGPLPAAVSGWPPTGKPGDAAFDQLSAADQTEVNRIAANVGKAFEAYMRRNSHRRGRFDDSVAGTTGALTASEAEGLSVFFKAGCDTCHSGPQLADDSFHVIGVPPNEGRAPERARGLALDVLALSPFRANGPFHDGPPVAEAPARTPADEGAYRTPSLRNVSRTGPWGHNGHFDTLEAMVDFHLAGGAGVVDAKLQKVSLSAAERAALLDFLKALDTNDPPSPWNNWPDR